MAERTNLPRVGVSFIPPRGATVSRGERHQRAAVRDPSSRARLAVCARPADASLDLLAEQKSERLERACVRWHGRLETEATFLSLAESQLALAALASLCAGERDAVEVLRRLLRRLRPTSMPRAL